MAAMTQKQFSRELADRLNEEFDWGLTIKDVEAILDEASGLLEDGLRSKKTDGVVVIRGIGRIRLKKVPARKARPGRNPATGEEITISAKPASKKIVATFDKALRDALGSK